MSCGATRALLINALVASDKAETKKVSDREYYEILNH